ncbi:MAG: InlB B-repeat-containing protein [Paludibacteraceae bacterium]|nr:InlB B-repeat-containing protein [Paludibacteraceae bacterium]
MKRFLLSSTILLTTIAAYGSSYGTKAVANATPTGGGTVYVAAPSDGTNGNWGAESTASKSEQARNAPTHTYTFQAKTNSGYTFNGWYDATSGGSQKSTNLKYSEGVTGKKNGTNTITRYARWTAISYSIQFNGNGATSGSMSNLPMTYGTAKNLTANAYKRAYTVTYNADGGSCGTSSATATYSFQNWNTNAAGTGTTYTDKQEVNKLTTTNNATVTLYAKWSSASVTLPAATKAGGVLEGWYNGTTKIGDPGDSYTPTANVTLKAKWIDKYTPVFTGSNQSLKVGGEVSGVFSFEHTENPEAHITVTSISDVNNGSGKVIEYDAVNNKIIAQNAGTATIYFTQAETSTIKSGTSATYTVTVTKFEPLFTLNKNTLELEQTATLSCEHTDGQTVTFSPEGKVSYNASTGVITATTLGETTMTVNQPETNSLAAKSTNFTITVIKKTPTLTVKMNNVAQTSLTVGRGSTTSISFDKVSDAEVVVTPVSGTQYASYVNGVMTAGAVGQATYRATLAETDTYQSKSVDFTLTVTSNSTHLPVSGKQYTLGSGSATDWTHSYETLSFSGIPDKLSFNFAYDYVAGGNIGNPTIQCPSGLAWLVPDDQEGKGNTHLLYVEESSDGSSWTTIWTDDSGDSKDTKSSGDIPLSKTTRHLRFHHSCNFKNTYTNIRVTELKYVETPSPESIDFGEAIINSDEITKTATVNWCNIAPMTVTSNDQRIIVSPATFGNFEQYKTQILTFKYQPSHTEESVNTTVTLTNATGTYNKTINVKAATVRRQQVITWNDELSSTGYAMNVGEQYPDEVITPIAQATNKGRIIFTSANPAIVEVIADTALLAKGIGKVNITAHQAGDAEYQPVDSTIQFTVTDLRKQSIDWNQDLFDLLTTSEPRTLTATATSGMAISYTSANPSVVKVEGNTLTVVSAGETYITATQVGGTDAEGVEWLEISQNNYVIVRDPDSPCGEMAATKSSLTFKQSNAPEPFALEGIPGELTFKARHEKKTSTIWGTTTTYSALIVEQYALKNNLWDWYEVFNQVVGTSDGSYGPYTLDESATKLRVRTLESGADHIVSDLRVTRKQIMTADVTAIDATADCNAIWQNEITVTHSNIDMMTITSKQGLLTFSEPTLGSGCRDYGDDSFTAMFTPLQKNKDYYDTIVISDNKADPTTVEIPVHIHSKGLTQYINDFVVPATALSTDAIYASATATSTLPVTFATSDESIARVVNGNQIEVVAAGEVKVIAIQDGGDRFDSVADERTLTISKVTPSIPVQSVDVRYADEWNNAQLATCKATVTWQGTPDTEVNGEFEWISNEGEITLNPGSYKYSVTFKPTDTGKYNEVSGDVEVNVLRALSVISAQDKTINARLPEQSATIDLSTLVTTQTGDGELSFSFVSGSANATINDKTFEATAVGQFAIQATIAQTDYYESATADFTITVSDGVIFNGSNGSSWTDNSNWGGVQPGENDRVIIDADVTITADDQIEIKSITINEGSTVVIKDGGSLTVGNESSLTRTTYGNIIVEAGGQLLLNEGNVEINDFTLYSTFEAGNPKSGQISGAAKLNKHGHAYFIIDLDPAGNASAGWYDFTVPFPVNALTGITRSADGETWNTIVNERNYAIMDFHEDLRAQGQYAWKKYRGILQPGVAYTMTIDSRINKYRFEMAANGAFNTATTQALQSTNSSEDAGWNGVGNGTMSYITLREAPVVQMYNHAENAYNATSSASQAFAVGAAYFVQRSDALSELTMDAAYNATSILRAPQREQEEYSEPLTLTLSQNGLTRDNLFVTCSENATDTYTRGFDVQKLGELTAAKVARLWTNTKGKDLCAVYTPYNANEAIIPLLFFAPEQGEYTLSIDRNTEEDIYLTRNGVIIWDMNMSEYNFTLEQGTDNSYALQVIRRTQNVATGAEQLSNDAKRGTDFVEKMIVNGQLFILRDGNLYDAQGKKVTAIQ